MDAPLKHFKQFGMCGDHCYVWLDEKVTTGDDEKCLCGKPRWRFTAVNGERMPMKCLYMLNLKELMKLLFGHPVLSTLLRYCDNHEPDPTLMADVYDGKLWRPRVHEGEVRMGGTLDAFSNKTQKTGNDNESTPFALKCLNWPPWVRNRDALQILLAIIPGPKCKNVEGLTRFILERVIELNNDWTFLVWDAYSDTMIHPIILLWIFTHDTRAMPKACLNMQCPALCACKDCKMKGVRLRELSITVYPGAVRDLSHNDPLRAVYRRKMAKPFRWMADEDPWVKRTHAMNVADGLESENFEGKAGSRNHPSKRNGFLGRGYFHQVLTYLHTDVYLFVYKHVPAFVHCRVYICIQIPIFLYTNVYVFLYKYVHAFLFKNAHLRFK